MKNDEVYTPLEVVKKIYDKIKIENYNYIWSPFDEKSSQFIKEGSERNLNIFATHQKTGEDFFKFRFNNIDLLISNPPFSLQFEILERCFQLVEEKSIKSFCLLFPLSVLETEKRGNLFEKYNKKLSIIILKKRIKFIDQKNSFDRGCCWICYNIQDLPPLSWL